MDASIPDAAYEFAGFRLDPVRGALFAPDGKEMPLRRKSFQLLRLMVENAGRLLDRAVIARTIWSDVVVTDESIAQCVRDLRRVLGDESQRIVRTVRGRGYLLAVEVRLREHAAPSGGSAERRLDKPAVAVLAFTSIGDDPDQECFSDGIAADVITALSRSGTLFVVAHNSSLAYKGRAVDVRRIAHELDVRYVAEGSVQRRKGRVRVAAQLADAETGLHIWSECYDRAVPEMFAAQDEISAAVANAIVPAVAKAERQRAIRKPTDDLSAWEAYQRAQWHWLKGDVFPTVHTLLRQAVAADPHFAPAHAMLAWYYVAQASRGTGLSLSEGLGLAEEAARTAFALDDEVGRAALAWVLDHRGETDAALEEAELAIAASPNDPHGYLCKGSILAFTGRPDAAHEWLEAALRLDPLRFTAQLALAHRAAGYYFARDYAAAELMARAVIRTYPMFPRSYPVLAAALAQSGRAGDAGTALGAAMSISPSYFGFISSDRPLHWRAEDHVHLLDGLRKAGWRG